MRLSIRHETTYDYADVVRGSIQYLRLTPQESARQRVLEWQLDLPHPVRAQRDPYGNVLHVLSMDQPHDSIIIGARGVVEIDEHSDGERASGSPLPFLRSTRLTQADQALCEFALAHCGQRRERQALIELMHGLAEKMPYTPGATSVQSTAAEAFAGGAGVCQDHTHAFLACARSLGVPARYVSATYIVMTASIWPVMPGPRRGLTAPGIASTSPTACRGRSAISSWPSVWTTWMPVRCVACVVAVVASRCMRGCTSAPMRYRPSSESKSDKLAATRGHADCLTRAL